MSYEVQFQHEGAEYAVRGPDIDGVLRLIQGVQGAEGKSDYERCQEAAVTTLRRMKYEWRGGEQWAPPIGKAPAWIEWDGGSCPVPAETPVEVELSEGNIVTNVAGRLGWWHDGSGDIVRYRVCA